MRRFPVSMTKIADADIADYAVGAGFPVSEIVTAISVALAESGGDPTATHQNSDVRKTVDMGLWQINNYWNSDVFGLGDWRDPRTNAEMARTVFDRQGWQGWSTYKSGSYKKFVDRANAAFPVSLGKSLFVRKIRLVQGDVVARVQRIVDAAPDGVYGPMTADRVKRWQKDHGLVVDGVVGEKTAQSFGWHWTGN